LAADLVAVAEVKSVDAVAAPAMTVVKNLQEKQCMLSFDEKIRRFEDLTLLSTAGGL
jgi:hypothetical protein